jgi:DNA-binding SARP family transcriptional activator/DNA-binding transcriptional regulator YiaG
MCAALGSRDMPQERSSGAHALDPGAGLGAVVRARRQVAGLTQQQLATLAGVSVAALRDLEQGRSRRPRRQSIAKLATVLGLDPAAGPPPTDVAASRVGQRVGLAPAEGLWLVVLGPLAAWRAGQAVQLGAPRLRAMLGLLAVQANTLVHRETIVDAFWGQEPPASAVNQVQSYAGQLRRGLDPGRPQGGLLLSVGASYQFRATAEQLDLVRFRQLAGRAHAARDAGEVAAACALYQQAVRLWRGRPLADVDLLRGHPVVVGVGEEWAAVVARYAELAIQVGWAEQVEGLLRRLAELEPLNERAHALLMLALAAVGQQAAALRVYQELRGRLDEQLGVAPGPELADAQLRVLRQQIPRVRRAGADWRQGRYQQAVDHLQQALAIFRELGD